MKKFVFAALLTLAFASAPAFAQDVPSPDTGVSHSAHHTVHHRRHHRRHHVAHHTAHHDAVTQ